MWRMHLLTACAVLAIVGLFAAGCGGGSGGEKKAYALSKGDYVSALNKICTNATNELKPLSLGGTMDSFKTNGDQAVKVTQEALDKIKALSPPDEVKKPAQEFTDAIDHSLSDFKDAASAAKSGDQSKFAESLTQVQSDAAKSHAAASEMGADGCS